MEKSIYVGKYIFDKYEEQYGEKIDEMKMHKIMYFILRESLINSEKPLFDEPFYGWKYGPVLKSIRSEFKSHNYYKGKNTALTLDEKELIDSVYTRYVDMKSWKLSRLSHAELSWKKSRVGLEPDDDGNVKMDLKFIKLDALRELADREVY